MAVTQPSLHLSHLRLSPDYSSLQSLRPLKASPYKHIMAVTNHGYTWSLKLTLEIQPKRDEKRMVVAKGLLLLLCICSFSFCSIMERLKYTSMQMAKEVREGRLNTGERKVCYWKNQGLLEIWEI